MQSGCILGHTRGCRDVPISGGTALEGLDTDGVDTGYHPVVGWYGLVVLQWASGCSTVDTGYVVLL